MLSVVSTFSQPIRDLLSLGWCLYCWWMMMVQQQHDSVAKAISSPADETCGISVLKEIPGKMTQTTKMMVRKKPAVQRVSRKK